MAEGIETIQKNRPKPKLNFWQIWNMSFGFLGIQFGFALQNANVSRIFETLGAKVDEIPVLWIAAPLTGLIIQPIIGYMSDRTWGRLGRRRPYFLVGAILASLALLVMPNSPTLWFAAGMLWIMDASINISMEPFRAYVGDMLPSEQRTSGFAMQSFFIGLGAVVASMLPWILTNWFDVRNTAAEGIIPDSVKWSFYAGGGIFLLAVLWTVFRSKEYSPEELAAFTDDEPTEFEGELATEAEFNSNGKKQLKSGVVVIAIGLLLTWILYFNNLEKELYILTIGISVVGLLSMLSGQMQIAGNFKNGFVSIVNDFQYMPKTMRQLAVVQFFSWFALFAMWIYSTKAVTGYVFGATDTTSKLYNDGADWVGIMFAFYNVVTFLVAFLIPVIARNTSRKFTHMISLIFGGLGLISYYFISDYHFLLVSMVGIGIAWASILSMPYAILTDSLPSNKMGYYMGVFNFFIVIPQLVAASILGFLVVKFFEGEVIYALIIGAVSMFIAAFLVLRVDEKVIKT
jgi:maltose/moltooligosaccharide transporter